MKLSVVMSFYKEPINYLVESIESILNQTYKDFTFVIVCDNPDRKDAISLIEQYQKKDNRVQLLINEKNMGLVYSLNRGINATNSDLIARMDADDISHPDRLEVQLNYLLENSFDLVGSSYNYILDDKIISSEICISNNAIIEKYFEYGDCVAHPTWLMKKKVFASLGGYRNLLACEDFDFLLRTVQNGFKISNCKKILFDYRLSNSGLSRKNAARQYVYTEFLRKKYAKGIIVNDELLNSFLISKKTEKKIQHLNNYVLTKIKRHDQKNIVLSCVYTFILFLYFKFFITDLTKKIKMKKLKKNG